MQQDKLNLQHDKLCQKMLSKLGNCFPSPEIVKFSDKVVKINRKGKEQERVLLLTDKAIYNLMTSDHSKCKRRIDLESIESVTLSTVSLEFVLHIPHEYDYRYKSADKERMCGALSMCYSERTQFTKVLVTTYVSQSSLLSVTVTKDASRLKTREERYRRYKELLHHELTRSDEEDVNEMQGAEYMQEEATKTTPAKLLRVNAEDFDFLHVIGRGSFGKVMLVKKKDDGEILAMKVLKKRAIIARKQVQHTKSERLILAQLQQYQHPFLMKLRFAFQTAEKLYFVLDYYRGGELFFHLKKRRHFTEAEVRIFVAEVAMALGHLHALNVIYRDLKPENILLDHAGHVCLTDFGLSKQQTEPSLAHTFCGTPEYLAPEIIANVGHSKAVDWWSLGILAYELSIGIPPYYSQNVNEMYRKIQSAPLQFPPSSSKACRSLISLLLERDPKYRLGSGHDDVREIQRQAFFRNIDWQLLYEKKIEPVYKPNVKHDLDVSNFDDTFTSEPVAKNSTSMHNGYSANHEQDPQFEEFSFVATANDNDDDDDD